MTLEKFHFTVDGEDYSIPKFATLPMGVIRKARKAEDETNMVFDILEAAVGEDSDEIAAIDRMTGTEFQVFLKGWMHGASVGESVSSES